METFGIDFEQWYQKGMWNDHYINYSYFVDGKCVSNASFNKMTLLVDGKRVKGIQIGTVMTDPAFRGKGYAASLIEAILNDQSANTDVFFLCAEASASNLYQKLGFAYRQEEGYEIDVSDYKKSGIPLKPTFLSPEAFERAKQGSVPLSEKLCALDDVHVANFYYSLGFDQMIYEPMDGVFTIFETEGDTLFLYDIYSKEKVALDELLPLLVHQGIKTIKLLFTPDEEIANLKVVSGNTDWMVRPVRVAFPEGYKFPIISRT